MSGIIEMKINIEHERWFSIIKTKQRQPIEYMTNKIMEYNEFVEARIEYVTENSRELLAEFNNGVKKEEIDMSKVYRVLKK